MTRLTEETFHEYRATAGAGRTGDVMEPEPELQSLFDDHLQAREDVKRLADELEECMATVAMFHGPAGLAIYVQYSPEMKRWRALLAEVRT